MKKLKKIILFFPLILALLLSKPPIVLADSGIYSIDIRADIQDDGSVIITDKRKIWADSGTEHYISIGNLENMEITDFKVEEEGVDFSFDPGYDINASLEEKRGKFGFNFSGGNTELCWGIGSYGDHTFKITYRISNFVMKTSDGYPFVYWTFYNKDIGNTDRVRVLLTKDGKEFSTDNSKIWGFGFNGQSNIDKEGLSLDSGGSLNKSNQMIMLAVFEKDFLPAHNDYGLTKDKLVSKALEGSSYDLGAALGEESDKKAQEKPKKPAPKRKNQFAYLFFLPALVSFVFPLFPILFIILVMQAAKQSRISKGFMPKDKKAVYTKLPYYTEYEDFFVDTAMLTENQGFFRKDWITAFFLKWILDGSIFQETEEKGFIFKRDEVVFRLNIEAKDQMSEVELFLFEIIEAASGEDLVLDSGEFRKYSRKNRTMLDRFEKKMLLESKDRLEEKDLIYYKEKEFLRSGKYLPNDEGKIIAENIYGFKNYLNNYSLLSERETRDVHIWDKYLIWAGIFGIAEKVYKELEELMPDFGEITALDLAAISMISDFSSSYEDGVRPSTSSSSGSGGSTSSGGGGGSFGGGSGGGTR